MPPPLANTAFWFPDPSVLGMADPLAVDENGQHPVLASLAKVRSRIEQSLCAREQAQADVTAARIALECAHPEQLHDCREQLRHAQMALWQAEKDFHAYHTKALSIRVADCARAAQQYASSAVSHVAYLLRHAREHLAEQPIQCGNDIMDAHDSAVRAAHAASATAAAAQAIAEQAEAAAEAAGH